MATKPLKSLKFPTLDDTYTVPQVDDTMTVQGAAADAKKVGDELTDIKGDISELNTATAEDVGKALLAKTVADGKVTEWEFGEAGGLPDAAVSLLITILEAGVYTSDQSDNITALIEALGGRPIEIEKVGRTLVFKYVDPITSITQSGSTLVCA